MQQAKREYLALTPSHKDCELFAHLLPRIAEDRGQEDEQHREAFQEQLWNELKEASEMKTKGPKPALCRWYSWVDSHKHWKGYWHMRLLLLYLWGLGCGVITQNTAAQSFSLVGLPKVTWTEKKETMKEAKDKAQRVRSKGKTQLHVSLLILMNSLILRKANCVYETLQEMRLFHGLQVKECSTSAGNLSWSIGMAAGSFLAPLLGSWRVLYDPGCLKRCGFLTSQAAFNKVTAVNEPASTLEQEEAWAEWLMLVLVHLTRVRFRHLLFYVEGPGLLAGVLSEDKALQDRTLAALKQTWEAWQQTADLNHPALVKARARCWLSRPVVQRVFESMASLDFEGVPEVTLGLVRCMFQFVSTKVIEDAFQRLRFLEQRAQANKVVSPQRMWQTLITKKVLTQVHHWPAVSHEDVGEKRLLEELPRMPPPRVYKPQTRKTVLPLHKVVSTKSEVPPLASSPWFVLCSLFFNACGQP